MKSAFLTPCVAALLLTTLTAAEGCSASKPGTKAKEAAVQLTKATAQDWVAGTPGGRSGTELTFVVNIAADDVQFGKITLAGAPHEPTLVRPGEAISREPVVPKKGDTLHLRLSVEKDDPAAKATEATIGYSVAGDARTLAVPAIEKLAPLPRP